MQKQGHGGIQLFSSRQVAFARGLPRIHHARAQGFAHHVVIHFASARGLDHMLSFNRRNCLMPR